MTDDPLTVCCQHLAKSQAIIEAKDAEIAQLQEAIRRLADQDATLSVCDGNVTVTLDATLTDEEREAVQYAIGVLEDEDQWHESGVKCIATLRKLLERLG